MTVFHFILTAFEFAFVIVKQACDACDNAQQYDNYNNRCDNDIEKK